jgi:acyl carrier protein
MTENPKAFIVQLLLEKGPLPAGESVDDYRYLDAGHVDSLGLVKFVFRLEERFNIRIDPEDINSEQFRSVGGLSRLIESKVQ